MSRQTSSKCGVPLADHVKVLDAWRGVSILLVLVTHLAPLGPHANASFGLFGMALFFVLSGFLITTLLLREDVSLRDFAIRRVFRIVPLAWLYFLVVFLFQQETPASWIAHFLFYANLPPPSIRLATDHIWSVCVEVQFYVGVAMLFWISGRRGLLLLPIIGLLVTALRAYCGVPASSVTWFRIDEILAGCFMALVIHGRLGRTGETIVGFMRVAPAPLLIALLAASSTYGVDPFVQVNYLRPYFAALLIGSTLVRPASPLVRFLDRRVLYELAAISYAVYVIHMALIYTWLGSGNLIEKYAKRPLLLAVLFGLAWVSTHYFEHPMIRLGKRIARRLERPHPVEALP